MNSKSDSIKILKSILHVGVVLILFLVSIDLLIGSLGQIGKNTVESILEVTANPFVSLFIGLLITALMQSSSTSTSMIVAMVASGSIDMHRAIPIIMGANIGTTLTSNIVSLNFITKKKMFSRAFSAATLHDHFNILITVVLFPLQYRFNLLGQISERITIFLTTGTPTSDRVLNAGFDFSGLWFSDFILDKISNPPLGVILSVLLLFGSIKLLTNIIYKNFIGSARLRLERHVFKNKWKSFAWGASLTAAIQSSSVTTSIVVPLVATGKIKLKRIYPFIVGANIGTTITALLASLFKSPEAISIAIAHFMFNFIGGIMFLAVPYFSGLPKVMARIFWDYIFPASFCVHLYD